MNSGRRTARQEEEYHVLRRNAEMRKQEERTNVDSYFKTWNIKTTKYASWTSPKYFKQSDEARVEAERKEKKQQTLVERRDKLRQAMDAEYKLFRDELQGLNSTRVMAGTPLNDHKSYNPELKRRSEQSRKREAELKQYKQWYKQQQPELRDFQRKQHIEHLKKTWIDRMNEYEAIKKQEAEAGEEYIRAKRAEIKRQMEEKFEEKFSKEEEIKWLDQQIEIHSKAINELVDKSKEIVKEVAESRELQAKIEKMIIKRHLLERKQADDQLAEEAKKTWETQEKKWAQEQQARDLLMKEVLVTIKRQVDDKLRRKSAERVQAIKARDSVYGRLCYLNGERTDRRLELKYKQFVVRSDLEKQVRENAFKKSQEAEKNLAKEINKMQLDSTHYKPRDFRRRRVIW